MRKEVEQRYSSATAAAAAERHQPSTLPAGTAAGAKAAAKAAAPAPSTPAPGGGHGPAATTSGETRPTAEATPVARKGEPMAGADVRRGSTPGSVPEAVAEARQGAPRLAPAEEDDYVVSMPLRVLDALKAARKGRQPECDDASSGPYERGGYATGSGSDGDDVA